MRFWQKASMLVLIVFLIGLDAVLFIDARMSYRLTQELVVKTAQGEQAAVKSTLVHRFLTAEPYYVAFNERNTAMQMATFGEFYRQQQVYMQITTAGKVLYSTLPGEQTISPMAEDGSPIYIELEGRLHLAITEPMPMNSQTLTLTYVKDVDFLVAHRESLLRSFLMISMVSASVLWVLIALLFFRLTKPLRTLNRAAVEIAEGKYMKRAPVQSRDEIGEFAGTFNRMADAVQRHVGELEAMAEAQQRFVDNFAHELRTPLTAIIGYSEMLQYADILPEERQKALTYVHSQSKRMKLLAERLMALSQLQHDTVELAPADLRDAACAAQASLGQSAQVRGISLVLEAEPASVLGDAVLLETLAVNLTENALRACAVGGHVRVCTGIENGRAVLVISDDGAGIGQDDLPLITEPFYRADTSRSRANGGVGLGLTLCKQICALHGATMNIRSEIGEGTHIRVEFTTL